MSDIVLSLLTVFGAVALAYLLLMALVYWLSHCVVDMLRTLAHWCLIQAEGMEARAERIEMKRAYEPRLEQR